MNTIANQNQHRFTRSQSDLIIDCLIACDMVPNNTLRLLESIAVNQDDDRQPDAQAILDWIAQSEQSLQYRVIYDFKRNHYKAILRKILEDKGIPRLIKIMNKDDGDKQAIAAFELLHNIVKGKPKQKVEMTGFVTHEAVQKAVEQVALPKQADGVWINPEDALDSQDDEQSQE